MLIEVIDTSSSGTGSMELFGSSFTVINEGTSSSAGTANVTSFTQGRQSGNENNGSGWVAMKAGNDVNWDAELNQSVRELLTGIDVDAERWTAVNNQTGGGQMSAVSFQTGGGQMSAVSYQTSESVDENTVYKV